MECQVFAFVESGSVIVLFVEGVSELGRLDVSKGFEVLSNIMKAIGMFGSVYRHVYLRNL